MLASLFTKSLVHEYIHIYICAVLRLVTVYWWNEIGSVNYPKVSCQDF